MMVRKEFFLAVAVAVAMFAGTANAQLTLELTGTPGSNEISYTAGGSFTTLVAVPASTSSGGTARAPAEFTDPETGEVETIWIQGFDNELGDVFIDSSFPTTSNDDILLSVAVPAFVNGFPLGSYETIDLDQDNANGDDVELDNLVNISYIALDAGDVLSWGLTSGTFRLDSGNFEDIFNVGTFASDSELYIVTVNSTATVLLGDVNLDGAVDFLDISPFISVLSGGTFQAEADIDENGFVDFLDISPFIGILSGS